MKAIVILLALCTVSFTFHAEAATARTTKSGVYTAQQASAGSSLYKGKCEECHGANLEGGMGPALVGASFMNKWNGMTLEQLYSFIHEKMPASAPGSLSPTQAVEQVAYILQQNKMPAGKTPLSSSSSVLSKIRIEK